VDPSPSRVADYLDRIGYDGPAAATPETLTRIHRAHMLAVPFENLDIHLGVPIVLSVPAFYEKIVTRRRGGFCYELNGLFAWLLAQLGFPVTLHSARVTSSGRLSPEFDHLVLSVALGGRWIADVGFGDSSLVPLPIVPARTRSADGYAIHVRGEVCTMGWWSHGFLDPRYLFTLAPRRLDEFEARCEFQQTSPESHFTQNTICSRATRSGRISLAGGTLIVTAEGTRTERAIGGLQEYGSLLRNDFGIELTDGEIERLMRAHRSPAA